MPNSNVATYDIYLAAWSAVSDHDLVCMLHDSLCETIVFTNPNHTRNGIADKIEHLESFQKRTLGGSFCMNSMVGWANH